MQTWPFFQVGNTFPAEMRVRFAYSWDKKGRYQHVGQSALPFSEEACHQVGIFWPEHACLACAWPFAVWQSPLPTALIRTRGLGEP